MKKTDNLLAWRAFLTVAKVGSVSDAAKILALDSPNVSTLISGLEEELGCLLFDRSHRPFTLTRKGHDLAASVGPFAEGIASSIENLSEDTRHIFTVAAPLDLNFCYIHEQLFSYTQEHPGVRFYLRASCPLEAVLSGQVDIALIERPLPSPDLVIRHCIEAKAYPMASAEYVKRNGNPQSVEELSRHTGLLLRQGMHRITSTLFRESGEVSPLLKWGNTFMSDSQLILDQMLFAHKGITIDCVPQHMIREIERGEVVPVLPGWARKPQELCIVTRRDREATSDELHEFALWWRQTEHQSAVKHTSEAEDLLHQFLPKN